MKDMTATGRARAIRTSTAAAIALAIVACGTSTNDGKAMDSSATAARAADPSKAPAALPGSPDAPMQAVLDELAALHGKPVETLTPAEARKQPTPADAAKAVMAKLRTPPGPPPGATLSNINVTGATGSLPANLYTPDGAGPFPVIVYYHGGGWVIANKDVYDGGARSLAIGAKAVVISADYRLGPEHKFPAAHDDAIAVYEWALKNAASLKGDPKRIALAGESAGGGLAVATAIAARDRKLQAPLAVISVYPIAGTDTTTPSYVENAAAKPLNRPMMSWFFDNYLRSPADRQDPRVNLVSADLKGLPPVTIINAQIDPLRSDGEILADKIRAAGGTATQKTFEGVTHEFFGMGAVHDKAKAAEAMATDALIAAFGK